MNRLPYFLTGLFLLISALISCTSDNDPNSGIIPVVDSLQLRFTDTTTLVASIERDDTIATQDGERVLLGSMNDPVFGKTTSSFYSTLTISQSHYPAPNTTIDSVILTMRADGGYGDMSKFTGYQVLEVFELTEVIPAIPNTGYNSYTLFDYNPVPLATHGFSPQFFPFGSEPAAIRIKLNPSLANRFFTPNDTINSTNILDYIKGIYVRISPNTINSQSSGQGGIVYFKLNSDISNIKIYFHTPTVPNGQLKLSMAGPTANRRFSVFHHDYSPGYADPALVAKLANPNDTTSSDKLYIHTMEGIRIKVKMPHISNYLDSGKIIVNRAEFVIPVDPTQNFQLYPPPGNLMIYFIPSDGLVHSPIDLALNYAYYDSFYDPVTQKYKIVITQHIQQMLNDNTIPKEFYIDFPYLGNHSYAFRLVVNSTEHTTNPIRLNLTYTRIPSL